MFELHSNPVQCRGPRVGAGLATSAGGQSKARPVRKYGYRSTRTALDGLICLFLRRVQDLLALCKTMLWPELTAHRSSETACPLDVESEWP